jgi:uncharacterized protein YaeQ
MHLFEIALSDIDRGEYAQLELKVARHPSESDAYMCTRVLAYALEHQEGIAFSQGLSASDEPAVWVRDLTGRLKDWIEVGAPDAARLHRASKAADRVVVYCHKDIATYQRNLAGQRIHNADQIGLVEIERGFLDRLCALVGRRNALSLVVTEGQVYLEMAGESLQTQLTRHAIAP